MRYLLIFLLFTGSAWAGPAFHEAAEKGQLKQVTEMLKTNPEWLDSEDDEGETALMEAAEEGKLEVVRLLIDRGADINHQDWDGETALMEAVQDDRLEVVELLLQRGAALGCLDSDCRTVLDRCKNEKIGQLLRNRGAR
jgi:ankyrin repeat protein